MKLNSHLLGLGIGVAALIGWMWFTEKEIETFKGYKIIKSRGRFVAERLTGERNTNPDFSTLEEVRTWVGLQPQIPSTIVNLANALPWSQ